MSRIFAIGLTLTAATLLSLLPNAESNEPAKVGPDPKEVQKALDKAVAFLKTSQGKDGSFSPKIAGPGITAIVVAGLLRNGVSPDEPIVAKGLKFMEAMTKEDGGIYDKGFANYTTAVGLMALKEANTKGKYDAILKKGAEFIKGIQHTEDGLNQGGFGYNKGDKGDMSNSAFSVEALLAAGVDKKDPAIQKALAFITKCQNLPGETQPEFAKKTSEDDKGGFTYNPNMSDKSPHKTAAGGLRSLGGMTYSGLKSFLYAGVDKKDKRVEAAINWIRHHYTLDENPGMGKAGLFYYYNTFAKAMDAWGEDRFEDAKGMKHDWRLELFQTLQKQQKDNGSWVNDGKRDQFGETNPDLATGFALLSMSYCKTKR
jgi:Squalene-hopene cyclase C-terminal domain